MDELTGRWVGLEKQLYQQAFPPGVSLVLYDLTSVYFEGDGPLGISQYGHSRDHRSDRPQVLLAVAADARGVPLHLEVLRGNRGDTTTLQGLLATLRRRFGIREAVFVFDGGMSSKVNLEAMEALGLQYVTRFGAGLLDQLLEGLPAEQAPELWDRTQVMEIVREGKRYVIAGGPWRRQRDQQRRQARLAKAEAELKRLAAVQRRKVNPQKLASQVGRALQRLKAHKYFDYEVDPTRPIAMEPPDRSDPKRGSPGRPVSAGHQRQRRGSPRLRRGGPLQEPAGSGGCLLPFEILLARAPGASPPTGSGAQPCAALLPGLLAECQAGTGNGGKRTRPLKSTTCCVNCRASAWAGWNLGARLSKRW